MTTPPPERLRLARERAGYDSATEAARAMGISVPSYTHHENGTRGFTKHAARYAQFFGVSLDWLLAGKDKKLKIDINETYPEANSLKQRILNLPIKGFVRAGTWQEIDFMSQDSFGNYSAAPDHRFPLEEQFLLQVQGDSMNAAKPIPILEGCLLKCVSFPGWGRDIAPGQIVVVNRLRKQAGEIEATVKRVAFDGKYILLNPESTNKGYVSLKILKNGINEHEDIMIVAVVLDLIYPQVI